MKRTYSTERAAKEIGIAKITLQRWISSGLVRASIEVPMKGITLRRWTKADVERARKLVGMMKPGRRPKSKTKSKRGTR